MDSRSYRYLLLFLFGSTRRARTLNFVLVGIAVAANSGPVLAGESDHGEPRLILSRDSGLEGARGSAK
jgi:hypothetical protein